MTGFPILSSDRSTTCASRSRTAATCAAFTACRKNGITLMSHYDILSYEEIYSLVKAAAELGINRVRLTGGEPLVRAGLPDLVSLIADIKPSKIFP